jgi:hypothetical protein
VQEGLGGGRYAVRFRHGQKGGCRRGSGTGDHRHWRLLQWSDHGRRVALRDAKPLCESGQGTGRGIAEGAQCGQQHREEDVNPLIRFALAHAKQPPLHHLERVGLEGGEQEEQPIFRRRQGAGLVHGKPAGGAGFPIEAPRGHMRVERRLEGRDQLLKLVERHAREIQELRGAGLQISEPYTGHRGCLLSLKAQYTINRDKLSCTVCPSHERVTSMMVSTSKVRIVSQKKIWRAWEIKSVSPETLYFQAFPLSQ